LIKDYTAWKQEMDFETSCSNYKQQLAAIHNSYSTILTQQRQITITPSSTVEASTNMTKINNAEAKINAI